MATEPDASSAGRALDDLALVRRVARQDAEALGELYDRYAPRLLGVARRMLDARLDAEEAMQEAFLQAWAQAARYDPARASVETWLVLLARGCALDRRRARQTRRVVAAGSASAPGVAPPEDAAAAVRSARVREALESLDPAARRVLELAFWEGLSPMEIALRTATPLATVQSDAVAGLRSLRHALREEIRGRM